MFEGMDADESGALSTEELSEGLATLGYQVRALVAGPKFAVAGRTALQTPARMTTLVLAIETT
jgi:hypothetical protein